MQPGTCFDLADVLSIDMLTEFNGFMRQPYKRLLRDRELWSIVRQAGPALKRLALDFELKITETGLHALLHFGCVNIRHLDIRANGNICTSTINEIIAQAGPRLETVVLVAVGAGNAVMKQLLLHAPGLKNLDLSYSLDLTFDAFPPIDGTEQDQPITNDDATKWEPDIVWDSDSLAVVRHPGNPKGQIALPKLEELQLRQCSEIDDTAVSRILSDRALASLAIFCPKLEAADISKCSRFSDTGVVELAQSCRGLKYLDISWLAVTDNSLTVIGNTQRDLEVLLMSGCPRITSTGVMAVMEGSDGLGCQFTLRRFAFNDCANVDKDTYEWCKRRLNPDAQLAQV
ncbi:hypothetical protein IWW56_002944 [Coemansia sp. RSA 2131]|nr:hypothetical protein IWW56_002944 [Coemansia sp. RSA 2131]